MSSNPLYGLRKVETFVQLTGLPDRPVHQPVFAGCTRRLCDRQLWLVTKSALEVYVVHDDALYKLTIFTFTFNSILYWSSQCHFKTMFCFHPFGNVVHHCCDVCGMYAFVTAMCNSESQFYDNVVQLIALIIMLNI